MVGVGGSNPLAPTNFPSLCFVAQMLWVGPGLACGLLRIESTRADQLIILKKPDLVTGFFCGLLTVV
jgi:hypothetical protein